MTPANITERQQDIFELDYKNEWCLCHCISEDLAMGRGVAVMFKQKFGRVDELKRQSRKVGQTASLQSENCRIYYLITKPRYFHKPTYTNLEQSLVYMRTLMEAHKQQKLAMPMIGCGLDKLEWMKVKDIICNVFADSGIDILVCRKSSSVLSVDYSILHTNAYARMFILPYLSRRSLRSLTTWSGCIWEGVTCKS
jgi:O-acetyl-ADP-ribose deacetylase (regulator of RNase III)